MSNNYEQPVEPMSRVEDILRGDTANVPQSRVEDLLIQLIEQGGGGGGSTVIVTQILSEGTKIATISVNGSVIDLYAPTDTGSEVSISTIQQTGTKIATLTIDDTDYDIYAPEGGGNLYGTTDPTNDMGNNGDIYMKYQGGSEPVESDYKTAWSGTATVTSWGSPYTFPFDVTRYHKLKIGNNEKLVSELKTYSYLIDHQAEDEWWILRDFPAAELCLSDADPTKLQLYGQSGYTYTVSEIQGTTMDLQPPQILNVFGKVEDEWVGFPGYSETVLYDTPVTPTIQSPATIELNDSYRNYDALIFYITNLSDNYYATPMIMTRDIAINHRYLQDGYGNTSFAMSATFLSDTSLTVERPTSSGKAVTYEKIYGIKYGNGGGSSSSLNYSTDEQVVGTWIDGKPLYQKTVEYTVVDQGASGGFDITSDFPATYNVRNCVCEFEYDYQGTRYSLTNAPTHYFNRAGNASTIKFSMGSGTISGDLTVTAQYTKTTD